MKIFIMYILYDKFMHKHYFLNIIIYFSKNFIFPVNKLYINLKTCKILEAIFAYYLVIFLRVFPVGWKNFRIVIMILLQNSEFSTICKMLLVK